MSEDPARVATVDQALAEARDAGRIIGAFFAGLKSQDVQDYEALRLALAYQRRVFFPEHKSDPLDFDADV